ncbi:hypothetical protein [Pseudonocardia broussonetiae]|uniref:Uncharacterized protein n=1 Tax=Pseudonocardia broussonetiae TaxID=2736640 RepID=A0A6M6JSZ8_9PSEU|nr:hypothetical protein [Pseudonocardia broussonetiae]QJY51224.1 hypothetical protein HOP40_35160 [Pseudonocardia broussonetiae]
MVVLVVVGLVFAFMAGAGVGAAFVLNDLRPETVVERTERRVGEVITQMQAVHDAAMQELVRLPEERGDLPEDVDSDAGRSRTPVRGPNIMRLPESYYSWNRVAG